MYACMHTYMYTHAYIHVSMHAHTYMYIKLKITFKKTKKSPDAIKNSSIVGAYLSRKSAKMQFQTLNIVAIPEVKVI